MDVPCRGLPVVLPFAFDGRQFADKEAVRWPAGRLLRHGRRWCGVVCVCAARGKIKKINLGARL